MQRSLPRLVPVSPSQYVPFKWLLNRAVQYGCVAPNATKQLLAHPDAPAPWDIFESLNAYAYPDRDSAIAIVAACAKAASSERHANRLDAGSSSSSTAAAFTVHPNASNPISARMSAVDGLEYVAREILACPRLSREGTVLDATCRALLVGRHFELASIVFLAMDPVDVTQATWAGLIRAARLVNTDAVERLVAPDVFPLAWELSADAASQLMLWGGPTGGKTKARTALLILRRYLAPTILAEAGVPMPCSTRPLPLGAASEEQLTPGVAEAVRAIDAWSTAAETTPGSIMDRLDSHVASHGASGAEEQDSSAPDTRRRKRRSRRNRRTPELTQRQWGQGARAVAPVNPIPLRVFFEIARAKVTVADGALDTTALHWRIQWRAFQLLNRAAPQWYKASDGSGKVDDDAEQMVFQVIDSLTRGASPWLAFHLAHHASYLGIVDGVDIALYLLMRTHRGEYAEHGAAVAKLVFNWLLGTAAIYRRPERQPAVINACRVLIQLGMQQELSQLYELVVENVSEFDPEYRAQVATVLADVTCPSCHSMLPSNDPHIERACHVCGDLVAARPVTERASFEMSAEARERLRARSIAKQKARSAALISSAKKLRETKHVITEAAPPATVKHHADLTNARTADSAQMFKEAVLSPHSPTFGSASEVVWVGSGSSLAPEELQLLKQRGDATASAAAEVPIFSNAVVPSRSPAHDDISGNAGDSNKVRFGPWSCCWCGERNDGMARRDSCSACGAYSGPAAEWRIPVGAPGRDGKFDPIDDFRARVKLLHALQKEGGSDSSKAVEVALGAGMHLLVYRRAFALRASKADGDYALVSTVVEVLCRCGQRVLAAAVYFGLIPMSQRQVGHTLTALATAFGKIVDAADEKATKETEKALGDTRALVRNVLGENICTKCYGAHSVTDCALVTRKFKASAKQTPGGMTPAAEKPPTPEKRAMQLLARMDANAPPTVLTAYAAFLSLEDRDGFAQQHAPETNFLALMLRQIDHVKRSALVACHLPLHVRTNDVLRGLCSGFAVELEEYREMIAKRTVGDASTHHPNFVQLTRTCCICFDGQHASHACPKLLHWLHECAQADSPDDADLFKPAQDSVQAAAQVDTAVATQQRARLPSDANHRRAAVAGWTGSGPERLLAFSKFLLNRVDAVSNLAAKSDVISETLNLVIVKLAASGQESHAYRLYAWSPMPVIQRTTTATLLRVRNFDDAIVEQGLKAGATGSDWRLVALPSTACLLCFREGHSFQMCPELQYLSNSARWLQIIQSVASFKLSNVGILAAAQAITYDVLCGKLTTKRVRESPELGKALCRLAHKCFAAGIPRHGAAFLRVLPVELLTPSLHISLWRAAGKTAESIERDMKVLEPALERFGTAVKAFSAAVSAPVSAAPAPPKAAPRRGVGVSRSAPQKPADAGAAGGGGGGGLTAAGRALGIEKAKQALAASQADYRRASTAGVCHRCFGAGHEAAGCELHQAEVLFGRDMIAAFRIVAMDDYHFTPAETYATTLQFARFIAEYHRQLPYHISSVTRAANAAAALLAMMGNAPAALRVLLYIPASFRASHVFAHILARYDLPLDRIEQLIGAVDTPADPSSDGAMTTEKQVLNIPPQPDLALEKVFHVIPNVDAVIASGEHELAATDVTDETQPTKVTCVQHCTMHDLSEALLERITQPLEERTGTTFGSRMRFLDVTIDEDLDLLDNPGPADDTTDSS